LRSIKKKDKKEKLRRHLLYKFKKAVYDYDMVSESDHVMVCLSGGKDSFSLLDLFLEFSKVTPVSFKLTVVFLDHQFPQFPVSEIQKHFDSLQIESHVFRQNIHQVLTEKIPPGKTACGLCGRLRRGALYRYAEELAVTKIALGHHMDDMVETLFLNLFHGGKIKGMPPSYTSDNGNHQIIRPMAYIREAEISHFANEFCFPVIDGDFCGSGSMEHLQRKEIKSMMTLWEKQYPGRVEKIFSGMQNVELETLALTKS